MVQSLFQFTPLREGRLITAEAERNDVEFQFTPLREGRRCCQSFRIPPMHYFNSRPSARGDQADMMAIADTYHISIHAPPRGATVFIFTSFNSFKNFNSRPSARGDADG